MLIPQILASSLPSHDETEEKTQSRDPNHCLPDGLHTFHKFCVHLFMEGFREAVDLQYCCVCNFESSWESGDKFLL
jgi:hypothetical protein